MPSPTRARPKYVNASYLYTAETDARDPLMGVGFSVWNDGKREIERTEFRKNLFLHRSFGRFSILLFIFTSIFL